MYMQDNQQQQHQQGLLRDSSNYDILYRNFVHSIKSPRTRREYATSLQLYMNWLSIYDYSTILQKDPDGLIIYL
jgi:hypothetical protein